MTKCVTRGTFRVTNQSVSASEAVTRAHAAIARRAWVEAHELFTEAAKAGALAPNDRPLAAEVAYAAGHLDVTIELWEQAHADAVRAGEQLAAAGAAVRVAMHLLFDTALMAPVRGWLQRAERLLGPFDDARTPVHAWLAVVRNYERMLSGDAEGARAWARRAIDVGAATDPAAAAIGRIAQARGLILAGEVPNGLAELDEAGVAATSGELDPLSTGVVYCELVCALQGLAQFDRAEEWTNAMERWCAKNAVGSLHGRCRVHRAEILRLRGSFDVAEEQLRLACNELRPYVRRELGWPLVELARVKRLRGDLDGAEETLLEASDIGWDAQPELARVHLARGDIDIAAASIREAIERPSFVPSKELPPDTDLRRAPLYEAQVEIAIAARDVARAQRASEQLTRIANRFASKALVASSATSQGRVFLARGEAVDAARAFDEAARLWSEVGAPWEAAMARLGLADAQRASGHVATADLELGSARALLRKLGVGSSTERAQKSVAVTSARADADRDNVFRLEGDTWALTFDGRTVRVRDRKGVRYIARLLEEPGREISALDLAAAEGASDGDAPRGDSGPLLDAKAKQAYRRRLEEIEADIREAEEHGDRGRASRATEERELLARELSRAFGLGGRERPAAGSATERARVSVTRAMRQALLRIAEHHAALGAHLNHAIATGTFCAYAPDPKDTIKWKVLRDA